MLTHMLRGGNSKLLECNNNNNRSNNNLMINDDDVNNTKVRISNGAKTLYQ